MADDKSSDLNQDAADHVKQRGPDATVDLGKEPGEQQVDGVAQDEGEPKPYSGDVRDTVNDDVEESKS